MALNEKQGIDWQSHSFATSFTETPILISQVASTVGVNPVLTRQRNITSSGFDMRLQEAEGEDKIHAEEKISYIAIEPGVGEAGGLAFSAGRTGDSVTQANYTFSFDGDPFTAMPGFLAAMQTFDGSDTANVRYTSLSSSGATIHIDEETSHDKETKHTTEDVGYLAWELDSSGTTILYGNAAPLGISDEYYTATGEVLTVSTVSGILANDTDGDGDTLTATLGADVQFGVLTLNTDGSFSYTPDAEFTGTDTFTYYASDGYNTSEETTVAIPVKAWVDLDIDSNNDNGQESLSNDGERSNEEDLIEAAFAEYGKIIALNKGDLDEDGIADFADGFDLDESLLAQLALVGISNDNAIQDAELQQFTPIIVEVREDIDLSQLTLSFAYDASRPDEVTIVNGELVAGEGIFRIWKVNGGSNRLKAEVDADGDFVAANTEYSWWDLKSSADPNPEANIVTLYVEAIRPSEILGGDAISVFLNPATLPVYFQGEATDEVKVTAEDIDFDVRRVIDDVNSEQFNQRVTDDGNPGNGVEQEWLDEARETTPGAFILINNDDDDYDGKRDFTEAPSTAENDLLPISIRRTRDIGGEYILTISAGLRVWQIVDGNYVEVVTNQTRLSFGTPEQTEIELFVEAKNNLGGQQQIELNWSNGTTRFTNNADVIKFNVIDVSGARNVPGQSYYEYVAQGAKGPASSWVAPRNGTERSNTPNTPNVTTDRQEIFWVAEANFGKARYQASEDYTWAVDVAIVQIDVDVDSVVSPILYADQNINPPSQTPEIRPAFVNSTTGRSGHPDLEFKDPIPGENSVELSRPAMRTQFRVTNIEGPTRTVGGVETMFGIDKIEMGLIQIAEITTHQATYARGGDAITFDVVLVGTTESLSGKSFLDMITGTTPGTGTYKTPLFDEYSNNKINNLRPWYDADGVTSGSEVGVFQDDSNAQVAGKTFQITDTPQLPTWAGDLTRTENGVEYLLSGNELVVSFDIYFAVRTTDTKHDGEADRVLTQRAKTEWSFDGSGSWTLPTVNGNVLPTWAPSNNAGVTGDDSYEEVTDGSRVPAEFTQPDSPIANKQLP